MAPPTAASPIRVAIIDDDSGLVTVLDRRFARLRWEREVIGYAATPDQLSALRIHAVILNPEITGLDYLERIALALPGLALLVCTGTAPVADRVRGLRGGRRRLDHQALPSRGADGPDRGRAAAPARGRAADG